MIISGSGSTLDNEAISTLKSRKLLTPVIQKLNLQATIHGYEKSDGVFARIYNNIKIELAHFRNSHYPSLTGSSCPLKLDSIIFNDETPLHLKVHFPNKGSQYQLFDSNNQLLGQGTVGIPFISRQFQFTLTCVPNQKETYSVTLWPLQFQAAQIAKNMKIETDKNDKNLLKIAYQNRDRHLATAVVNELMGKLSGLLKTIPRS